MIFIILYFDCRDEFFFFKNKMITVNTWLRPSVNVNGAPRGMLLSNTALLSNSLPCAALSSGQPDDDVNTP